ncbi:hypothetical protein [Sphingobium yanoikuyae]|uniref:hypothetical protein n=1 Tax=Sphingobium yanoikuyae TaxID=13690 RepID=UPI00345EAA67
MTKEIDEILAELSQLSACRPQNLDLKGLSRYKIPGKVNMALGGLIWRAEELGRNALDALSRQDFVTSAILTRALMETAGGIVLLHNIVEKSIKQGLIEGFDKKINSLLMGSKNWEEMDNPIHVNDMLREVQKIIPNYLDEHYASLSEYAHPNWCGAFGAYGTIYEGEARISFSHDGDAADRQRGSILGRLCGSIGLCLGYYHMVEQILGDFVTVVEAFYADRAESERAI